MFDQVTPYNLREGDRTGELGRVGSSEGQLAVGGRLGVSGLKGNRQKVLRDSSLREEIVGYCGDGYNQDEDRMMIVTVSHIPVGIAVVVPGERVPVVRSTGPILTME